MVGGAEGRGVLVIVATRHGVDDARIHRVGDRLIHGTAGALAAQAHVDDLDFVGPVCDIVNAGDDPGDPPAAVVLQDLDGPQAGARGYTYHARAVVNGGDGAGNVGAVAVAIVAGVILALLFEGTAPRAVRAGDDVEVRMVEVDAGVDDGHIHVDPQVVIAVDRDVGIRVSEDALDPGGDRLYE